MAHAAQYWSKSARLTCFGAALLSLGACTLTDASMPLVPETETIRPLERPERARPAAKPISPSAQSQALQRYFSRVQNSQLSQGLLRRDGGGPDTRFTDEMLIRNFEHIAFFNEHSATGMDTEREVALRKWVEPVRVTAVFGNSVRPTEQRVFQDNLTRFVDRLANVTQHPISVSSTAPNFFVLFANEDERPALLRDIGGQFGISLNLLQDLPRDAYCAVAGFGNARSKAYSKSIAVIRTENPDLLSLSCIHEEVAQGLGLPNDSALARPSIFNDDDEFALLTTHDEMLLRILYDGRLTPGMARRDAMPIVRTIAREVMQNGPPA